MKSLVSSILCILLIIESMDAIVTAHNMISSAESQKGVIADQRRSVENQKGAIAIYFVQQ